MFEVAREITAKIGTGRIHFLDFVLVEARTVQPAGAQKKSQSHDQHECRGGATCERKRAFCFAGGRRCG